MHITQEMIRSQQRGRPCPNDQSCTPETPCHNCYEAARLELQREDASRPACKALCQWCRVNNIPCDWQNKADARAAAAIREHVERQP